MDAESRREHGHATAGHLLVFEERGPPEAPAVVCLHGLAGDRAILVEALDETLGAAGLRRLYVDLPGHGASTGNPDAAGADELVAALASLVTRHAGPRPLLVGYSYGGYLTLGLLRDVEARGALLVCPVVEPDIPRRTRPARAVWERSGDLSFSDEAHERETFEEVAVIQTAAALSAYRRVVLPASRRADRAFLAAVRARYAMSRPVADALIAKELPMSILCGRDDHWVGFEDAARLLRVLPRASLHVLDACGHLLPLERAGTLRLLCTEWLARVAALAPAATETTP